MNSPNDHDALFARMCDGLATDAETAEFHRLLCTDPAALDAWIRYSTLHADLATAGALAKTAPLTLPADERAASRAAPRVVRFPWLPQAAAGLIVGLCAASLVWAYVAPLTPRALPLLEEDFENAELPIAVRAALETGIWRGDRAAIVGPERGVAPAKGQKMVRFLRGDIAGVTKPDGGHIAVFYRLLDLRPLRSELSEGDGVVEVSASFNAVEFPAEERYRCAITLFALDSETLPERVGRLGTALTTDALAMARSSPTKLDQDPASWQRATTELRLPANAEFLVVRLHVSQAFESGDRPVFDGAYADDVRVSFVRRAPLP